MAGSINKPKKPKSKRTPVRLRHRIEKAAVAKQRKQRKLAKKNPEWRSKLKKDPGIPNLFPYKEKLLHQIEQTRLRKLDEAQRRRELAKAAKGGAAEEEDDDDGEVEDMEDDGDLEAEDDDEDDDGMDVEDDGADASANPMAALVASARKAARDYKSRRKANEEEDEDDDEDDEDDDFDVDDNEDDDDEGAASRSHVIDVPGGATSRKAFDKVFKAVVEQADVVLYVLDARDPEGTRSRDVERAVLAGAARGKRLVLVLNKVDLVPPPVLQRWLAHLRAQFPTLPLRAAGAAPNAATFHHRDLTPASTSAALFRALKAYAAARDFKRAVAVGVIGYPNVGKSSVINALLSRLSSGARGAASSASGACPTGAAAGVTTAIRSVKIDRRLTLLDSPGIVFPSEATTTTTSATTAAKSKSDVHAHLVLLNAVPPQQIEDPVPAVALLLRRLAASPDRLQQLAAVYDLPPLLPAGAAGDTTTDFLVQVARKRGRLGRGGVPNLHAAAMTVLTDWRDGRIQGWMDAPAPGLVAAATTPVATTTATTTTTAPPVLPDQKQIVTEWAKEFKLDGLWGNDTDAAEDATMAE